MKINQPPCDAPCGNNHGLDRAATACGSLMNTRLFDYAPEIRSAVLVIHGENAHSLMYSKAAFALLKGDNKELLLIPNATHTDLYDQQDKIPFDQLEGFFKTALGVALQ